MVFSEQAPRLPPGATPLGGFSPVGAQPWAETNAAAPLPMPVQVSQNGAGLGPTETSPPYKPNGGDRTDFASPLQLTPRPGGTAVGGAPYNGSNTAAGTADFNAGGYGGTVPMDQAYGAPVAGAAPPFVPDARRSKAKGGPPLLLILLLALGIAGAVVTIIDNGNTLVSLTHGNKVAEFNPQGEIVWKVTNEQVGGLFKDPCGSQRLANGNTVVGSHAANQGISMKRTLSRSRFSIALARGSMVSEVANTGMPVGR